VLQAFNKLLPAIGAAMNVLTGVATPLLAVVFN